MRTREEIETECKRIEKYIREKYPEAGNMDQLKGTANKEQLRFLASAYAMGITAGMHWAACSNQEPDAIVAKILTDIKPLGY